MTQIPIKGKDGNPVRYAYLEGDNLKFQMEYFARDAEEGNYEVIQTVSPSEFPNLANMFGIDLNSDPLSIAQQISDMGRGDELREALNNKDIKCEIFTWRS